MIDPKHPKISIRRQCDLIGLNRSSFYMKPASESSLNLELMRQIDEHYLKTPFYGVRRMTAILRRQGYKVNHKRVARLMRIMGVQALFPQKNLSQPAKDHKIYPYLLRGVKIQHINQVWSTDITYVPMTKGFMYLVAIIDWFSRYVLTWRLSNTLDGDFCLATLKQALANGQPEIFNTDQGAQFTAKDFTQCLLDADVKISMDGKGRALDNIFVERLWRSVKYEDIYLKNYECVPALQKGLQDYFQFYNYERPHQSLNYQVPADVYYGGNSFPEYSTRNELRFANLWS
jgi:putative transposase